MVAVQGAARFLRRKALNALANGQAVQVLPAVVKHEKEEERMVAQMAVKVRCTLKM